MTGAAVGVGGHMSYQSDVPASDGDQLNPR